MMVHIRLFAGAGEMAGRPSVALELPAASTVADVRRCLVAAVPELGPMMAHMRFAMDRQFVTDETLVPADSQIACIPPVSGG